MYRHWKFTLGILCDCYLAYRELCRRGARVVMLCRSEERGLRAMERIRVRADIRTVSTVQSSFHFFFQYSQHFLEESFTKSIVLYSL